MDNPQSEEQLLSQAWNLFAKDDYAGVLNICRSGYAHGVRSYDMVRLMLDSLNKLGKVQEQAGDILEDAKAINESRAAEAAQEVIEDTAAEQAEEQTAQ